MKNFGLLENADVKAKLERWRKPNEDGNLHAVIEAVSEGVIFNSLEHSIHAAFLPELFRLRRVKHPHATKDPPLPMRLVAAALFAFCSLALLAGPPDAASVDHWIRDLDHDSAENRDAAEKHLAEAGEAVLEKLKDALASGKGSLEAQKRLGRLIENINHAKQWEKTWKENPLRLAQDYVKDRRCGTCRQDKVPFNVVEIKHEALAKRFPDLRLFALDWVCCEDRPQATIVLAVGREVDVLIEIVGALDWGTKLAPHVPAVKSAEEARETGSLLASLAEQPLMFDEKVIVDATRGDVEGADGAFTVTVPYGGRRGGSGWLITFDKDGKLQGIGAKAR